MKSRSRWASLALSLLPAIVAVGAAAVAGVRGAALVAIGLATASATLLLLRPLGARASAVPAAGHPPSPADTGEWADGLGTMILRENLTSLGRLASGVAHEFGNPLTTISSVAQLLERRRRDDEFVREQAAVIQTHVGRLTRLSRLMVDLSFPKKPSIEDFDLHRLVDDTLQVARLDRRFKQAEVRVVSAEKDLRVRADPGGVHLILLNLLFNAADAMGGEGEVEIDASRSDLGVEVRVRDTGPGIPEDIRTRIFAPFYSTKEAGTGTGLGLPISCRLARALGGELNLESTGPEGTCFLLLLGPAEEAA